MYLGSQVKDKITGFEGICIGFMQFYNNCDRVGIRPRELNSDGKPKDTEWFDITSVEIINKNVIEVEQSVLHNFNMLDEVEDTVTGYKGKITSFITWLSGCVRVGIQSSFIKDGRPVDDYCVAVQQVKLVNKSENIQKAKTGGPVKNPTQVRNPSY